MNRAILKISVTAVINWVLRRQFIFAALPKTLPHICHSVCQCTVTVSEMFQTVVSGQNLMPEMNITEYHVDFRSFAITEVENNFF
jgi:hypothetical protein